MADFPLFNDTQYWFLITDDDAAGAVVAAPAGDVDSVVSSNAASIAMTVEPMPSGASAGAPSVHVVPMVQATTGISCTLSDTAGLPMPVVVTFSVAPNPAPTSLALDTATVVTASQAIPAAPGP